MDAHRQTSLVNVHYDWSSISKCLHVDFQKNWAQWMVRSQSWKTGCIIWTMLCSFIRAIGFQPNVLNHEKPPAGSKGSTKVLATKPPPPCYPVNEVAFKSVDFVSTHTQQHTQFGIPRWRKPRIIIAQITAVFEQGGRGQSKPLALALPLPVFDQKAFKGNKNCRLSGHTGTKQTHFSNGAFLSSSIFHQSFSLFYVHENLKKVEE